MICVVWIYWKGRLPKAPFMHLSLPHQVLGKPNLIWVIPLVSFSWRLKDAQLPKRTPSWPHIWDIKELKQLQKESAINYVSQIAFSVGLALFRPWMRRSVWLWQAYLTKLHSHGGVENTSVVWKSPTLCRRGKHHQPGHLAVESHPPGHNQFYLLLIWSMESLAGYWKGWGWWFSCVLWAGIGFLHFCYTTE